MTTSARRQEGRALRSAYMGHANASFTFNVYCHMLPRRRDPIGDRLASLVFGNKMETVSDLEFQLEFADVEKPCQLET